jgi:hypothetical protein
VIPALCVFLLQVQPVATPAPVTYWGLKPGEWITIGAIVIGPFTAVLIQLWFQKRRTIRDQKLWVYGALISNRATWIAQDFVRAMNYVDVIFYKNAPVRAKRAELLSHIKKTTKPDGTVEQVDWDKAADLCAEMLDLMGKELGFDFSHTQIKDSAYYPVGHEKMDKAAFDLREKGLAILEGRAPIAVVIKNVDAPEPLAPDPTAAYRPPRLPR